MTPSVFGYPVQGKIMDDIIFKPIGLIRTQFVDIEGMPIQSVGAEGNQGIVELHPEYVMGLQDIEGYSHLILIYQFHLSKDYDLLVRPFLDSQLRGVFSTRAPRRPNPIGLSTVRLLAVKGNILEIEGVDIVDKTPLLDIKPFVSHFDNRYDTKNGWLSDKQVEARLKRSDGRFGGGSE
ncbi:MAG: tRNA (N6-threonylcarbamoyladenosine(37)-N6)-methyltransferase TrmO [Desulfomonilaceae bacterium]